jgi:hypothetical protein
MAVSSYIDFPIDADATSILASAYTFLQTAFPGWDPKDGDLDTAMLQALAADMAELKTVASAVPISIFRYFGRTILNIPPVTAAPASTLTTWTVIDDNGYTIPVDTVVSIDSPSGPLAFTTQTEVVILAGETVAEGVLIEAVLTGVEGSGLGSVDAPINLEDPLDFVVSVTQDAATSGGADDELDVDYLNRLSTELRLLSPRPILPHDFAVLYRNIPGVHRSTAVDGYNPADSTYNNERMITLYAIDSSGNAVDGSTKSAGQTYLDSMREINFQVNMGDPSLNQIDVTYTVKALPGVDHPALLAAIDAALGSYLSALNWGITQGEDPRDWSNVSTVRYLEIAQIINSVTGVDYITTTSGNYDLTIRLHSGSMARLDVAMTGVAPLPTPGVMTGTIT